jgi:hypothetical protein
VPLLGDFAAQEFSSRRQVVEKVAHFDGGTGGMRRRRRLPHRPAIDAHAGRAFLVEMPRDDFEPRHRRDRRQCLTAKAKRRDGAEIVGGRYLAGRMTGQRQPQLGGGDAAAIIAHAREAHAARFDFHLHALRAGVEAVLHQFLDDGCRPLDDLAGRDLIDELVFEDADRHGRAV